MQRAIGYTIYFITMVLLQAFVFNNLNLSVYIYPLVCTSFVMLLPIQTPHIATLMLGLVTGITLDAVSGTAGLHTIASLFTAFCRPLLLRLSIGREEANEGGIPNADGLGTGPFLRYSSVFIFLHCFVFFAFEGLSWEYFHLTLLRIVLSTAVTIPLVYLAQMLLIPGYQRKKARKAQ